MNAHLLVDLQRAVQNLLLRPENTTGDFIVDAISETVTVPRSTRIAIYANAYRARFVEALAADYSALKTYLGDDEFERLINAYIETYPSRYYSMRYVGQHLSDFLREHAPYSAHRDLYELAQFEWALCHAFDAIDMEPLSIDDLRRIEPAAWPMLQLQFHPSLQRLLLFGNVPVLWTALNAEQVPPEFICAIDAQSWIVWRQQLRLLFRPLAEHEVLVLNAFASGAHFAEVCEQLSACIPAEKVPPLIAGLIQQWLQEGLIV